MPAASPDRSSLEPIARRFSARTGIDTRGALAEHVWAGIARAMDQAGTVDPAAYLRRLDEEEGTFDQLVAELAVGETYFFRDPTHYALVRRLVLPEVRERRGAGAGLRAWSAGCASGEEPYSLAMLLAEEGALDGAHLVGTDIATAALERAKAGVYRRWSLRGAGAAAARPWLEGSDDRLVVRASLREAVSFLRLNLATDHYPERALGLWDMDVIFCRNVLIYFDAQTIERVVRALHDTLAPGGWLVTGPSDPPLTTVCEDCDLEPVLWEGCVFHRRVEPRVLRPRRMPRPLEPARKPLATRRPPPSSPPAAPRRPASSPPSREAVEAIRALADRDPAVAEAACREAVECAPLSAELRHLHGVLLVGLGRDREAEEALRRALYLDASLAITHFVLGSLLRNRGDLSGARRAFRNAAQRAAALPAEAPVRLGDGEPAAQLARAANAQLLALRGEEATP